MATTATLPSGSLLDEKLKKSSPGRVGGIVFGVLLLGGLGYIVNRLWSDLSIVHTGSIFPYLLLGLALLIALGFEFVNGFHDTANAVATVIYTHSLEPHVAVVWSGLWNFVGVLTSSGAVAYSAAGGADSEGEQGLGLCDGVCPAGCGDSVEPGDVVARASGVELAHDDRVDHWSRHYEPASAWRQRRERRGLGAGDEGLQGAAAFSSGGLYRCGDSVLVVQDAAARSASV
jgi:hypothetical protein